MSLRAKLFSFLLLVHLAPAILTATYLWRMPWWLLTVEAALVVSLTGGYLLLRSMFVPFELIRTGSELIREEEFTSHFREVGQKEMDDLIRVYNRMIDRLREERLKLEEQNLFLDKVLQASPFGVLTLDFEGRVSQINPAAENLLGVVGQQVVGLGLTELGNSMAASLAGTGAGGSVVLSLPGGRRLKCRHAVFLDRGFMRSFFMLEELTEELRASEKSAYEKLIRMMSHEVNNSVGAVRSLIESCLNYGHQIDEADRDDFRNALEVAGTRMKHLNGFMNAFADVVRLPPPTLGPCDLEALLCDIVLLLGPELRRRRVRCEWEVEVQQAAVEVDKNQLEQALVNILKNAAESIGEEGRITIEIGRRAGRLFLAIRDSGAGIAADTESQLFTPFFSTKRDGRGVGLTLTQEILSQHGFDYGLNNHADGGAEFWIGF
jgi:two-component system nitrogen regulation sensor histidine kinase NtrY